MRGPMVPYYSGVLTCLPKLWMALNTEILCMLFKFDWYVLSRCLCSKPVVDIWRLFGVFGREVACLWMEALSYCFYSSPTDTGWTFGFSQTWSLRMPRWSGLSGNAVYDFSLNNKVLDNRAIWGKKCSLSLRGCLYLCWKLLKKILFF